MSLSKALQEQKTILRGPRCTVCVAIAKMTDEDATALKAALDDDTFTHAAIGRALQAEGYRITPNTVQRHRNRGCLQQS